MYGSGLGDALIGLFYFGAFAVGFILAVAVIAALSFFVPVNLGIGFLAAIGVGACAALLVRLIG